MELFLMENEEVIQACSSHAAQKAFTNGIRAARVRYGVRSTLMPLVIATRAKFGPNFRSLSRIRYVGACPYGVASRSGTRHPRIGRKARHIYVNHLPRLQLDEKKGKKGTEEEIGHLQKITSPHLCRMIAQERFPILSTSSLWTSVLQILLNSSFTHPNIQLE
jgi:hypothetical protein